MAQEYELQQSPFIRNTSAVFSTGVEERWTPILTFETPGDLSVTYVSNIGTYVRTLNEVRVSFYILTSSFTHTTASNGVLITGLPFEAGSPEANRWFSLGSLSSMLGVTAAGYTMFTPYVRVGESQIRIGASGSGVSPIIVGAAQMPTGAQVGLAGSVIYSISN